MHRYTQLEFINTQKFQMPTHKSSPISKILHKAKTHKGRRILAAREPQFHEGTKQTLFLKGQNTSSLITQCLGDFYNLKKRSSVRLQRKNMIYPFQDCSYLLQLCVRMECGMFVLANHSKKRADNLILGRVYDDKVLDIVELGVESYKPISEFKTDLISVTSHPAVIFLGPQFEAELSKVKNLFLDIFRGPNTDKLPLSSIEHVITFSTNDVINIHMRVYRVVREGRNVCGLEEMGPRVCFKMRRYNPPDDKLFRKSIKVATVGQIRHLKNVSYNIHGSKLGRIHMDRQDYSNLQTRKRKALRIETSRKTKKMDLS
ncbi:hypothetical protein LOD99_9950 [Oopsacas minuta]|uniref:Ribosome production factor 2 homolog n=1 Tax=Oopsacas minuta TaxID=111878 RepID=A0AAV7KJ30_9METZ|nr:hypothetical protein LOD99_9950 [Oopsacas minuta]